MQHSLNAALMVLAFKGNHQAAITIPAGKVVDVAGSEADDRFVVITVEGEQFHAFASDLSDEAYLVKTGGK
jgi:hypothetical protein